MRLRRRATRFGAKLRAAAGCALAFACIGAVESSCSRAPARPVPENAVRAPAPRLIGRFDGAPFAGPRFAWSGSAIEARFTGTGMTMRLRIAPPGPDSAFDPARTGDTRDQKMIPYTVFVDDQMPRTIEVSAATERFELASGLDPRREHILRVARESEALAGVHQFFGLEVSTGGELLPPRDKRIEIVFVGDSISCGYGVLGSDKSCKFSFITERATLAYPWLVGRALDADVTTLCWSGRGVYRNYDADRKDPGPLMPVLFERTLPQDASSAWPFARAPQPLAVVVNLGTNDFLADHDGDGAPDPLDPRAFEDAYGRFLGRVREVYPQALVAIATSPMLSGALGDKARASLTRVVEKRRAGGDARTELVPLEEQGQRMGCDAHPNAEMHRVLAGQVETFLRAKLPR